MINDQFYHNKVSVFNQLGPKLNSKTYSEVVGNQEEYGRQTEIQKRINSESPDPHNRINSSQATCVDPKGPLIKITNPHVSQGVRAIATPTRTILPT